MSDIPPPDVATCGASREPRARWAGTVLWVVLLAILTIVSAWLGLRLQRIQSSYPGLSPSVSLADENSYGVNADLTSHTSEDIDRAMTHMGRLGLSWIRQPFPWAEIEPTQGQYDWTAWDQVVEAASAHNLKLIAVLYTTPDWARAPNSSPSTPPTEFADFGAFVQTVAERYGDQLDYYQVWDEPNLSTHWGDQHVDPRVYARLLREGALNVRAVDDKAVILTAALAPTLETGPLNLSEPAFLAGLYAANAASWFDVVAAQPYGFEQAPTAPSGQNSLNFARAELLRQVMIRHGDQDTPVWATAFGWSALAQPWEGQPSPWPPIAANQQAAYTAQAVQRARSNWPWLGPIFFAAWDTEDLPGDDPRRGLALVAGEHSLPQARPIQDLGQEVATVGTYPANHPSGNYAGKWRFSPDGADVPRHPPAALTIPFEGTRLDLIVRRGAFRAFLYVTIDEGPANHLPQQEGRSYLVLYDPLEQEEAVTLARHLPDGFHTARIEAEGGWYQWPIVGWRVSREGDTRAIQHALVVAGLLILVTGFGLFHSIRRPFQPTLRWAETLSRRYLSLGTAVHLVILAITTLAFYLVPGTLGSLGLLGLLFLAILPRPDLGLASVAFSLPFFLLPKSLIGRTISMTEVSLVLVALAYVTRRILTLLIQSGDQPTTEPIYSHSNGRANYLDRIAWSLTGLAALAGLLTVIPAANNGTFATADWPTLTLMLLPVAGVLAAASQVREEGSRLISPLTGSLDLAVITLLALAVAATLAAHNSGVSLQEFHVVLWDGAAFYAFVRLARCLDPKAPTSRTNAEILVWTLVDAFLLGASLMALYAIYQFFFTDQTITAEGVRRALGVYGSPNNLALLLDRTTPILIAVVAFSRNTAQEKGELVGEPTQRRRILYALGMIPSLLALVLTFSRGALLLGVPVAILFIGLMRGRRVLWVTLGILVAGGAVLLPLFGTRRFRSMFDINTGTGFFRLRLWQSAWAMLRDHPWLGVGLDNFLYQYRTRYILPDAWQEPNLSHPHNILLDFGTRLGVGGIAILLWLQVAFWRIACRLHRHQPEGDVRALTLGLMATMTAILAHGIVDNSFFLVDLAFIFFLVTACIGKLAVNHE
jgi:O-antigen ligase